MSTPEEVEYYGRGRPTQRTAFEMVPSKATTTAGAALETGGFYTLTVGGPRFIKLNATGGVYTIKLPVSTGLGAGDEGLTFHLSEHAGVATAVTIDGNGSTINGSATLSLSTAYNQRTLRWSGSFWIIVGSA